MAREFLSTGLLRHAISLHVGGTLLTFIFATSGSLGDLCRLHSGHCILKAKESRLKLVHFFRGIVGRVLPARLDLFDEALEFVKFALGLVKLGFGGRE